MVYENDGGEGKHAYTNKKKKEKKRQKEREAGIKQERVSQFIDGATLDYYRQVDTTLDADEFQDAEDKQLFVSNVLSVTDGSELNLCRDKEVSCILEKLLKNCTHFQVRVFFDRLAGRFKEIASDKFASHVLQTLLNLMPPVLHAEMTGETVEEESEEDKAKGEELRTAEQLVLALCEELHDDVMWLSRGDYGSHVIRTVLGLLAGGGVPNDIVRSRYSRGFSEFQKTASKSMETTFKVPESFGVAINSFIESIVNNDYLTKDACHTTASGVIQVLLVVLSASRPKECETVILRLLGVDDNLADVATLDLDVDRVTRFLIHDTIGSHVMERILIAADPQLQFKLYQSLFRGRIEALSKHPVANYVVQNMMKSNTDAIVTSLILTEISECLESIIASGSVGVVVRLVECVGKTDDTKLHKTVSSNVLKAFHMNDTLQQKQCVPCIMTLTTHDAYFVEGKDNSDLPLQLNGVLLVQALLSLKTPYNDIPASSLLSLPAEKVLSLCMQPLGKVIETFMGCSIEVAKKRKFMKIAKGSYAKLAMDKFGSRAVDACWAVADIKLKESLAAEMIQSENEMKNDFYGRVIWRNCRLDHFKRKKEAWAGKHVANEKKKDMFADILDDSKIESVSSKKKSKKGKREDNGVPTDPIKPANDIDDIFGESKMDSKKRKSKAMEKKNAKKSKKDAESVDETTCLKMDTEEISEGANRAVDADLGDVFAAIKSSKSKGSKKTTPKEKRDKTAKKTSKFMMA
eukprot:CFRG3110T1